MKCTQATSSPLIKCRAKQESERKHLIKEAAELMNIQGNRSPKVIIATNDEGRTTKGMSIREDSCLRHWSFVMAGSSTIHPAFAAITEGR